MNTMKVAEVRDNDPESRPGSWPPRVSIEALAERLLALAANREAIEAEEDRVREYLLDAMVSRGLISVRVPAGTISYVPSRMIRALDGHKAEQILKSIGFRLPEVAGLSRETLEVCRSEATIPDEPPTRREGRAS